MIGTPRNYFFVGFPDIPMPVADVWCILARNLEEQKALPEKWTLSGTLGHPLPHLKGTPDYKGDAATVERILRERNPDAFAVQSGNYTNENQVSYTLLHYLYRGGTRETTALTCTLDPKSKSPPDWSPVVEGVLERWSGILGWQAFWPYVLWQTTTSIETLDAHMGEIPPGYKRWHQKDPMGFTAGWEHVDTSQNPGRHKNLSYDVSFYPTAEMWFGPHFWPYAKCTKGEALAADFWLETRDTPHYTYFKCWPTAFTRPDGEQGRMQQRLWKLFFHEDCEWPPGSGTICDEPMYGPPELMP